MSNLNVTFKAPYEVIAGLKEIVRRARVRNAEEQKPESWDKLTEDERKESNRQAHQIDMVGRFFET